MDLPKKLKKTQLPPKEAFYSRLNNEDISDENYAHAQKVWKTFKMKSMRDYHDFIIESTFYFWPTSSKTLGISALKIII